MLRTARLGELDPDDESIFGGKACGLARLISAGVRVPGGYAVEATVDPEARWTECFREAVRRLLARGPVAVRSSAVGEDSRERSFAGLLETVLGIENLEDAAAAAAQCVASGGSDRVLAYAGIQTPIPVGVVIQSMVEARAAGVCFTQDPTGVDKAVVVEATAGRGDQLLAGAVEPERWRIYASGRGGWEHRLHHGSGTVLSPPEVERLAAQAVRLSRVQQRPLDLEWALDLEGTIWWLQARPITVLVDPPEYFLERHFSGVEDGPVTVWSNWNVRENWPEPLAPLTRTHWQDVLLPMLTTMVTGLPRSSSLAPHLCPVDAVHGRLFWNMNGLLGTPIAGNVLWHVLPLLDARAARLVRGLRTTGVLAPRRLPVSGFPFLLRILPATLVNARRFLGAFNPERCRRALEETSRVVAARPKLTSLSDLELGRETFLLEEPVCEPLRNGLNMVLVSVSLYSLASWAFRHHPRASRLLTTGIPDNPATQISLALDELVEQARPLSRLFLEPAPVQQLLEKLRAEPQGAVWLSGFQRFLEDYGHRGPGEFDLAAARWSEQPSMIVELIRTGLRRTGRENLSERMQRLADDRRRTVAGALRNSPVWARPGMAALARLVVRFMPLREAPKHCAMVVFQRIRQAVLELGRRWTTKGVLSTPEDVFFLEFRELLAMAERRQPPGRDLQGRVRQRKEQLRSFRAEPPPEFLRSDGVPVGEPDRGNASDDVLRGTPISSGTARGRVKLLTRPDPRALSDDLVLVTPHVDPGWTPLFPHVAAVVTEVGGMMSHAALVARELGIPAVFGVLDAGRILTDGEQVTVDGSRGTVVRGEPTDPAG